jgi:polyisoprenoid-binding protein YceI
MSPSGKIGLVCAIFATVLALAVTPTFAQVSTFKVTPVVSKITFNVKASVPIEGVFDKWDATMTFTSTDATTGVLDIKVDAASVNTGSGMKNSCASPGAGRRDVVDQAVLLFRSGQIVGRA